MDSFGANDTGTEQKKEASEAASLDPGTAVQDDSFTMTCTLRSALCTALAVVTTLSAWTQTPDGERWISRAGRGDGTFEALSFRVVRSPGNVVETLLPAEGTLESKVRVELDERGALVRSRTDYLVPSLSDWYRADFLLTEVQPGAGAGGADNLAFQRVWKNEVQEAKNLTWGPEFVEFSTLPFLIEKKLARGDFGSWGIKTYSADIPGDLVVRVFSTDRPLEVEKRYRYPRWLRERWGTKPVILAELTALGDFKGAYPFPFFYAFLPGPAPRWVAAWGGSPDQPSFQWKE